MESFAPSLQFVRMWGTGDDQNQNNIFSTLKYYKITKKYPFPSGVCHNTLKLSFRLFWTADVYRKSLCVLDNFTEECFLLPLSFESIFKSSLGFATVYWKSDIAYGYKILSVTGVIWGECWHCSFRSAVTIYQTSNLFCQMCTYMLLQFCWGKIQLPNCLRIYIRSKNKAQSTHVLYIN